MNTNWKKREDHRKEINLWELVKPKKRTKKGVLNIVSADKHLQ